MKPALIFRLVLLLVVAAFVLRPDLFTSVLTPFARSGQPVIYPHGRVLDITLSHLVIVAAAMVLAAVVAIGLAILVTRPFGTDFLPLSRSIANVGQTFPPVAVLALAVPVLGFGTAPTLVALFLYGLLPIFENALTGLTGIPPAVLAAARGAGMSWWQRLVAVELPLALPVILAGIRISAVIAMATATIGSTVAARTLGEIIIAGLQTGNTAFVLQGGLLVGALAVLLHDGLVALERRLSRMG